MTLFAWIGFYLIIIIKKNNFFKKIIFNYIILSAGKTEFNYTAVGGTVLHSTFDVSLIYSTFILQCYKFMQLINSINLTISNYLDYCLIILVVVGVILLLTRTGIEEIDTRVDEIQSEYNRRRRERNLPNDPIAEHVIRQLCYNQISNWLRTRHQNRTYSLPKILRYNSGHPIIGKFTDEGLRIIADRAIFADRLHELPEDWTVRRTGVGPIKYITKATDGKPLLSPTIELALFLAKHANAVPVGNRPVLMHNRRVGNRPVGSH